MLYVLVTDVLGIHEEAKACLLHLSSRAMNFTASSTTASSIALSASITTQPVVDDWEEEEEEEEEQQQQQQREFAAGVGDEDIVYAMDES